MAGRLARVPFAPEMLDWEKVKAFDCGTADWEREVTDWLRGPPDAPAGSAQSDMARGADVWFYAHYETRELIGVGSFGVASLRDWPTKRCPKIEASVIPMIGVDCKFQRKGYGQEILDDLIAEAIAVAERRPVLMLYVNEKNGGAIRWYTNPPNNFTEFGKPYVDKVTGFANKRMILDVSRPGRQTRPQV